MAERPDEYAAWFHIYMARHRDPDDAFGLPAASSSPRVRARD
jgi:hypothetical protein